MLLALLSDDIAVACACRAGIYLVLEQRPTPITNLFPKGRIAYAEAFHNWKCFVLWHSPAAKSTIHRSLFPAGLCVAPTPFIETNHDYHLCSLWIALKFFVLQWRHFILPERTFGKSPRFLAPHFMQIKTLWKTLFSASGKRCLGMLLLLLV